MSIISTNGDVIEAAGNIELAPREQRPVVPMVDGQLMPHDMDGLWRLAKLCHAAGFGTRDGSMKPEQYFIVLAAGYAAGLNLVSSLKNIMIINNSPAIWGDAARGLLLRHPAIESIEEWGEGEGDAVVRHCRITRSKPKIVAHHTFGPADVARAGLGGKGPHKQYPARMRQWRAFSFAARDVGADILGGLPIAEEVMDYPQETERRAVERAPRTDDKTVALEERLRAMPTTDPPIPKPVPTPTPEEAPRKGRRVVKDDQPPIFAGGDISDDDIDAASDAIKDREGGNA